MCTYEFDIKTLVKSFEYYLDRRISIREISEKTGVHRNMVSRLYNTNSNIGHSSLEKILNYFIKLATETGLREDKAVMLVSNLLLSPVELDTTAERLENLLHSLTDKE